MYSFPKKKILFAGFCLFFFSLLIGVEINNGKFWTNDLKVYYGAVQEYFNGSNPYGKYYGLESGYFKYPPSVLYLMFGMKFMSFQTLQFLHAIILLLSLIISIFCIEKIIEFLFYKSFRSWLYFVSFGVIAIHVVREVHIGNLNLLLLCTIMMSLLFYVKGKVNLTVSFMALAIIVKPYVILMVIPFAIYKKWSVIWRLTFLGLILTLIPTLFGDSWLWIEWLESVREHGNYIVSENSLSYLSNYYFGVVSAWTPSFLGLSILLIGLLIDYYRFKKVKESDLIFWVIIFLSFTPNFFVTDTEHFMLAMPMIAILIVTLINQRKILPWITFGLFIFCFSMNSNDLLKSYSDYLDEWGVLGLSNLGMISMLIYYKMNNNTIPVSSTSAIQ